MSHRSDPEGDPGCAASSLLARLGWILAAMPAQLIGTRVIGAGSVGWEWVAYAPALRVALAIMP